MALVIDVSSVIGGGDFTDFTAPASGSTDNGKVWAWNSATGKFSPVTTLTNFTLVTPTIASFVNANHDHSNAANGGTLTITGYLLATGATTGATSSVQPFTNGIKVPSIQPASDSTTAVRVFKADGSTVVLTTDTTNVRVGVGVTPSDVLHVKGANASGIVIQANSTTQNNYSALNFSVSTNDTASAVASIRGIRDTSGSGHIAFLSGSSEIARLDSAGKFGLGSNAPVSHFHVAGNISATAWGAAGILSLHAAATFTNTSTAAAGTVATTVANSFGIPTFASTNAITSTDNATVYIDGAPAAGTNTTITRAYGLWVKGGTRLEGTLGVFNTNPTTQQTVTGSRGSNAALASLLTALAAYGLIVDSSS